MSAAEAEANQTTVNHPSIYRHHKVIARERERQWHRNDHQQKLIAYQCGDELNIPQFRFRAGFSLISSDVDLLCATESVTDIWSRYLNNLIGYTPENWLSQRSLGVLSGMNKRLIFRDRSRRLLQNKNKIYQLFLASISIMIPLRIYGKIKISIRRSMLWTDQRTNQPTNPKERYGKRIRHSADSNLT